MLMNTDIEEGVLYTAMSRMHTHIAVYCSADSIFLAIVISKLSKLFFKKIF